MFKDNMATMNCGMDFLPKLRLPGLRSSGLLIILIAALGAGCAHSDKHKPEEAFLPPAGIPAPPPPTFMNGALAVLLTNVDGFRARVSLEGPASADGKDVVAGELMGRGGKLLFAPQPGGPLDKYSRVEDFSYVWNVAENRGFLLSGPLQGYAPISSAARFTNVVVSSDTTSAAAEKVAGYRCQKTEVKVMSSEGTNAVFQVWRAPELKGMPVRIICTAKGKPITLGFSRIRLETPPSDLFQPPSDFTKYASGEVLMNELVARQQNLKRKRGWEPPPTDEVGFRDGAAPVRQH
jgi:hypothetical protein